MPVGKENSQVCITLPKEVVAKVDKEAKNEMRSRSKQIAKLVMDHYKEK